MKCQIQNTSNEMRNYETWLDKICQKFVYTKYVNKSTSLLLTFEECLGFDIKFK